MPRFQIGDGPIYQSVDLDRMDVIDILLLEQQTAAIGVRVTWQDVMTWSDEIASCKSDAERLRHPKAPWITAVSVWVAKRAAGENITFEQAIDFPIDQIHFLPEPQDRRPANPTKAAPRKAAPRKKPAKKATPKGGRPVGGTRRTQRPAGGAAASS